MESLESAFVHRQNKLGFYTPYNFIQALDPALHHKHFVHSKVFEFNINSNSFVFETTIHTKKYFFLYSFLPWDSQYFKIPMFKLYSVLYTSDNPQDLISAIKVFAKEVVEKDKQYFFTEIPSEDILLMQCLGCCGFKTVENRLNYYMDKLKEFTYQRFPVRNANTSDIPNLKNTAITMRNELDRFHADFAFTDAVADQYLGTYIENCISGFCDKVLVPDEKGTPPDAFLAISYLSKDAELLNCKLSRVALTAVPPTCKGWHLKLVSETIYDAKCRKADYVLMTTQASNRAVINTNEKLGLKLGSLTHILTYYNPY